MNCGSSGSRFFLAFNAPAAGCEDPTPPIQDGRDIKNVQVRGEGAGLE